ncbi:MAG: hypothetical protein PWR27_1342 [Petroclostridium sp.]|jgi:hypothetical protein|uniref:hypothetical protein n=1 Tax=Petroclostridium xylanilyticum TaxID=1792311 RepID=UPI000B9877CC|nr:hypothetical protein [Petroclostridium xylanilyticum]MBZ4646544.1 hypothetical protein [Clostridia bacterium]MDK2810633.1 hypothetical protein [Petroclostridium sp.]
MRIEMNGSEYRGDYVDIVRQMKNDNVVNEDISIFEYANDVEYLMMRFFDKDVDTGTTDLEDKCESLVKELLRKGLARRLD